MRAAETVRSGLAFPVASAMSKVVVEWRWTPELAPEAIMEEGAEPPTVTVPKSLHAW